MKKYNGTSMVQYAIIIALIALVLIPIFIILGSLINNHFAFFNNCLEKKDLTSTTTTDTTPTKPSNTTNVTNELKEPVITCTGNSCSINFGDYILTGIPANYNDFVETHGTSGGTDKLLSMLEQIANQLEENGDIEGAKEYRELANLGHFISDIQEDLENRANACKIEPDPKTCLTNKLQDITTVNINHNILELLPEANKILASRSLQSVYEKSTNISFNRYSLTNFPPDPQMPYDKTKVYPGYAFINKFDEIINNPKYSNSLKGVTTELYLNISDLAKNLNGIAAATSQTNSQDSLIDYDPLTGEEVGATDYSLNNDLSNILHPQTSIGSDINSALICAAGSNIDTANNCHK